MRKRVRSSTQVGRQAQIDVVVLHVGTHFQIVWTSVGIVVSWKWNNKQNNENSISEQWKSECEYVCERDKLSSLHENSNESFIMIFGITFTRRRINYSSGRSTAANPNSAPQKR